MNVYRLSSKYKGGSVVPGALTDITRQVILPVIDNERVDDLLDSTDLTLLNGDKNPIRQDSRFVIVSGSEAICRIAESDSVEQIRKGSTPAYLHRVSLIEITKTLERIKLPNLTFTNYLLGGASPANLTASGFAISSDYMLSPHSPVEFRMYDSADAFASAEAGSVTELGVAIRAEATNSPLRNMIVDGTSFNVEALRTSLAINLYPEITPGNDPKGALKLARDTAGGNIPLVLMPGEFPEKLPDDDEKNAAWHAAKSEPSFVWIMPNGTVRTPPKNSQGVWTVTTAGKHTIRAVYYYVAQGNTDVWAVITVNWSFRVHQSNLIRYTYRKVLTELLEKAQSMREGITTTRYTLDASLPDSLLDREAPEFSFSDKTLLDALIEIGATINAIPRLLPDAGSTPAAGKWNTVSFDFLDPTTATLPGTETDYTAQNSYEDYATCLVSDVRNATAGDDGDLSVTEPYAGGWLSTRTEAGDMEINSDSAMISTAWRIQHFRKLQLLDPTAETGNQSADVSGSVVEAAVYAAKSNYDTGAASDCRANLLNYTRGQKGIRGLSLKKEVLFGVASRALTNVAKAGGIREPTDYLYKMAARTSYIPLLDLRVHHYRPVFGADEANLPNAITYNQQAKAVDMEAFGQNMRTASMRLGNDMRRHSLCVAPNTPLPKLLARIPDGVVYSRTRAFYGGYIEACLESTPEWSKLNALTALRKNAREWEIAEKDTVRRDVVWDEFLVFSHTTDTTPTGAVYEAWNSRLFNNRVMAALSAPIAGKSATGGLASYFCGWTTDREGINRHFLLPACSFSSGNGIHLTVSFSDNFSAGSTAVNNGLSQDGKAGDTFGVQDYIPYGDAWGQFRTLHGFFGWDAPFVMNGDGDVLDVDGNVIPDISHRLYDIPGSANLNVQDAVCAFDTGTSYDTDATKHHPLLINKDSREQITLTASLHMISDSRDIQVGPHMAHHLRRKGVTGAQRVAFHKEPSLLGIAALDSTDYTVIDDSLAAPERNTATGDIRLFSAAEIALPGKTVVGYGLVDSDSSDSKLLLYVRGAVTSGVCKTNTLFAKIRGTYS